MHTMRKNKFTRREMLQTIGSVGLVATQMHSIVTAAEIRMQAEAFFDPHMPTALQRALNYAGDEGFVASMPQLLHARTNAPYHNIIWNTWFTANSEESVVTTRQGNQVIVAVHGGGIFAQPSRLERSYHADMDRTNSEGITGQGAARITTQEAYDVLEGKLPGGTEIPIYPFDEFKEGVSDLPIRYGVILDYNLAKKSKRGYEKFTILKNDPNMIIRAGGVEPLAAYLDKFRDRHDTNLMGNWHPYLRIDPDEPQCRIPFLAGNKGGTGSESDGPGNLGWGYDNEYGLGGDANMVGMGRYVAVAKRDVSTSLRDLDFEL